MSELPMIPAETLAGLITRGRRLWDEFQVAAGNRHHLFVPCDHHAAYETLRRLSPRTATFLEFGSAAGIVTIMADLLGIEAYGIEIEPALVHASRLLATEFGSGATFAEGTFVPVAYQDEIEHLAADRMTPTHGACALDELGMELSDFDLLFAFPWPGEEDWLFEMMRRHARGDAILLTYGARDGFEAALVGEL